MTTLSNFKHTILSTPLGTIPQPSVQPCDNYTKESFENVVSTCAPFKIEQEVLPQIDPNNKFLNPEKRSQREYGSFLWFKCKTKYVGYRSCFYRYKWF